MHVLRTAAEGARLPRRDAGVWAIADAFSFSGAVASPALLPPAGPVQDGGPGRGRAHFA